MPDASDLITTEEVAALCRTSPATVRYWRHIGHGPAGFKLGRRVLYRRALVEAWLADEEATQTGAGNLREAS